MSIIEDKRTDRTEERRMKMKMHGRRSQISTRVLMSQRGPAKCWKLAGKLEKKHKTLDASNTCRKERFRTGVGPSPQSFQMIQSLRPLVTFSREPTPYYDDVDHHDKTHPFLVSYLRNLLALAVNF